MGGGQKSVFCSQLVTPGRKRRGEGREGDEGKKEKGLLLKVKIKVNMKI